MSSIPEGGFLIAKGSAVPDGYSVVGVTTEAGGKVGDQYVVAPDGSADGGMTHEEAQGVASLVGAIGGAIATVGNISTQTANDSYNVAQQNYQVTEEQNAQFLKMIAG